MADLVAMAAVEAVRPDYNIYRFDDNNYKVIHFNSTAPRWLPPVRKSEFKYDNKLDASLSRARSTVMELGLCNNWKYFCTFTLDQAKYDRSDLGAWHKDFSQWLLDQRKKYKKLGQDLDLKYLLVPEQHADGSWHMHGLFGDISPMLISFKDLYAAGHSVPWKLVSGGYMNWPAYQKKFGFCSFGEIKNKTATAFYVSKYVTKQLQSNAIGVGLSLYYPSRGLARKTLHGDIYGHCSPLDQYLTNHYDFCSTGMVTAKDGVSWDFALEYMEFGYLIPFNVSDPEEAPEVDQYMEAVQQVLDGF